MANLVDKPEDQPVEATDELVSFDEAPVEEPTEAPVEAVENEEEDDLPEKYKGKSAAEIARMHKELESRLGQQSQEVGELRKAFDDMVKSSIAAQNAPKSAPEAQSY